MTDNLQVVFIDRLVLPLEYRNHAILLGGKMVFNRKYYRHPSCKGWRYRHELYAVEQHVKRLPQFVEIIKVETSDGRLHYACSLTLRKLQNIVHQLSGCFYNPYDLLPEFWGDVPEAFKTTTVRIGNLTLPFRIAKHLKAGVAIRQTPRQEFRLMDGYVNDGRRFFPMTRPRGYEWQDEYQDIRFAIGITAPNWAMFLQSICGLRFGRVILIDPLRERMRSIRAMRKAKTRREYVKGKCFDGTGCETVAIGENLVFTGRRQGQTLHVVDSPEYGRALYVFDNRGDAHDWAARRIRFKEARQRAVACIIHTGQWEDRARNLLAS